MRSVPVTFVSSHAKPGGTERYLTLLLDNLGPAWIRSVVCLEHGPLAESLRMRGYPTEVLPTSGHKADILTAAWKLRRLLRRSNAAVLHADNLKAALISVLATSGSRIPVVWVKHDFSWDGWLARFIGRRCEQVIGVSSSVTRTFEGRGSTNVRVIHNGLPALKVDRDAGRRHMLSALGLATPAEIIALVGRLHPLKGHRELLALVPAIRERIPGAHVVFLGGEDRSQFAYADALRGEVVAAGLSDTVTFLGHRGDAVELISGCELVVIPTIADSARFGPEGFSYAGLEAMAVGTPVVGYNHGALPELLGDCGVLVPPGDRAALGAAITRLLCDPELRVRLSGCGRRRVADEFSLTRTVESMKEGYWEAAKGIARNGRRRHRDHP